MQSASLGCTCAVAKAEGRCLGDRSMPLAAYEFISSACMHRFTYIHAYSACIAISAQMYILRHMQNTRIVIYLGKCNIIRRLYMYGYLTLCRQYWMHFRSTIGQRCISHWCCSSHILCERCKYSVPMAAACVSYRSSSFWMQQERWAGGEKVATGWHSARFFLEASACVSVNTVQLPHVHCAFFVRFVGGVYRMQLYYAYTWLELVCV